jgi:hypothetical protein
MSVALVGELVLAMALWTVDINVQRSLSPFTSSQQRRDYDYAQARSRSHFSPFHNPHNAASADCQKKHKQTQTQKANSSNSSRNQEPEPCAPRRP